MRRVVHNPRMYEPVFSPSSFDFIFFYTNLGKGKELIRTKKAICRHKFAFYITNALSLVTYNLIIQLM